MLQAYECATSASDKTMRPMALGKIRNLGMRSLSRRAGVGR
jgi:hypothetical protein